MQYITKRGDVLDDIVWRQYNTGAWDVVQQVLDANHGLADRGPVLPAGVIIELPEIANTTSERKTVSLWD